MDTTPFPKSMSTRRARRWLEEHNPHPVGSVAYHRFAVDFWKDQSDKAARWLPWWLVVTFVGLLISSVAQIVAAVTR